MGKDKTLYWLGHGVLDIKGKDGKVKSLKYADTIPDGALSSERIAKLMKDGVIGDMPKPQKASESTRLQNRIKELEGKMEALKAGEDGKALARVAELEEENKGLREQVDKLTIRVKELEELKEQMAKEAKDLQDTLQKGSGGGVGPKGGSK
jgi:ribosomal protein L19E